MDTENYVKNSLEKMKKRYIGKFVVMIWFVFFRIYIEGVNFKWIGVLLIKFICKKYMLELVICLWL